MNYFDKHDSKVIEFYTLMQLFFIKKIIEKYKKYLQAHRKVLNTDINKKEHI